ncbi:hypothetical protein [Aurantiacibacter sp. D1-12]|uniref:hypothetical protein n=1 Tax=Aurantiacibacter sp. D1-12 TaxID=2993658 RepID=UPI00237CA52C|nr:hypothetical protein [Aurantiacibacter sp. D1-12]MDE1467137.1 hypothetical protein [Aurantiacibacter sp. D1-12]
MRKSFAILAAPVVLALAACGDDPAPVEGDENREASGEVLEGSISDGMIPLDELQSQAPLAAPEPGEDGEASSEDADQAAAGDPDPEPVAQEPAEPEPAAEPESVE